MEMTALADRLSLVNDNVLVDTVSGRKLVLNRSALSCYKAWRKHGPTTAAVREIAGRLAIPLPEAQSSLDQLVETIDQGQTCSGSLLPGGHHAVLEPTAGCNGGCPHCYHGSHQDKWPDGQVEAVVAELVAADIRSVSLTGGEVFSPHFSDSFFDLVARLDAAGVAIASVSTNATFLTDELVERIVAALPPSTVFRISLDALRGDLLDRIRPGYRKLADPYFPIKKLDAAGFGLVFTTNIAEPTIDGVLEIGEYLRRYENARAWNVRLAVPVHYGDAPRVRSRARRIFLLGDRSDPRLPLPYFEAILRRHAEEPFPFDVRMGNYLMTSLLRNPGALTPMTDEHPCREDRELVTFKATGQVTQCPILTELDPTLTMGEVDQDGDLVVGDDYASRLPLADLRVEDMACARCHLRPVCGGGCRLYAVAYGEGLHGCDLPAYELLSWILEDPSGVLAEHWPDYLSRIRELAGPAHG